MHRIYRAVYRAACSWLIAYTSTTVPSCLCGESSQLKLTNKCHKDTKSCFDFYQTCPDALLSIWLRAFVGYQVLSIIHLSSPDRDQGPTDKQTDTQTDWQRLGTGADSEGEKERGRSFMWLVAEEQQLLVPQIRGLLFRKRVLSRRDTTFVKMDYP